MKTLTCSGVITIGWNHDEVRVTAETKLLPRLRKNMRIRLFTYRASVRTGAHLFYKTYHFSQFRLFSFVLLRNT